MTAPDSTPAPMPEPRAPAAAVAGSESTLCTPTVLFDDRYLVVRQLGAGGFGRVLLVEDTLVGGKLLALKILHRQPDDSPDLCARFRNEIRVLRALSHTGIPRIFNDGRTAEGELYFTMTFVAGVTLEEALRPGPVVLPRMAGIARQVLDVLQYAHAQGVVHRDLKPANIYLVDDGGAESVRVLDFGIARILRRIELLKSVEAMQTVTPIGTPAYMAPEQRLCEAVDERADAYALGLILARGLTGALPRGDMDRDRHSLHEHGVPPALAEVILRLIRPDPVARAGLGELRAILDRLAGRGRRRWSWCAGVGAAVVVPLTLALWARSAAGPGADAPAWRHEALAASAPDAQVVDRPTSRPAIEAQPSADHRSVVSPVAAEGIGPTEAESRVATPPAIDAANALSRVATAPAAPGLAPAPEPPLRLAREWVAEDSPQDLRAGTAPKLLRDPRTGIRLVLVPGGETIVGCASWDPERLPGEPDQRRVQVAPFYLGIKEVCWLEYSAFLAAVGRPVPERARSSPQDPVTNLSLIEAQHFAEWLGVRLPREEEWEHAARAGGTGTFGGSDDPAELLGRANVYDRDAQRRHPHLSLRPFPFADGFPEVAPVGSFRANDWGIHDLLGNVAEWTCSVTADGRSVVRGGSWAEGRDGCRVCARRLLAGDVGQGFIGLRVAADVTALVKR